MKDFHEKNGSTVVYVQIKDIRFIATHTDYKLPQTVFNYFKLSESMDGNMFISFEDPEVVDFFKGIHCIINRTEAIELDSDGLASISASLMKLAMAISAETEKSEGNGKLKWLSETYEKFIFAAEDLQKLNKDKNSSISA